jgi:predicted DNA-binding transcriptional regulator AlpA
MEERMPMPTQRTETLISTAEAAARIGVAEITMRKWRWLDNPHQPPYVKCGPRRIRYEVAALDAWKASRTHKPGTKPARKDRSPGRHADDRGRGDV